MRVAIVGSGISGLTAAWRLQDTHDVTLFEMDRRLGGHTDTHGLVVNDRVVAVDSGFIVFNELNYPNFTAWLDELEVPSQDSDMSFSVTAPGQGVEYGTSTLGALFAQRSNLVSPDFWRLLIDLRRFYAQAAGHGQRACSLGSYLREQGYSEAFARLHIGPMCAALWSQPLDSALEIPLSHVVAFMAHHLMLQVNDRPQWRVVAGGSQRYVDAFAARFRGALRRSERVTGVVRNLRDGRGAVQVQTDRGEQRFDAVVLACHSNQALDLLDDPSDAERGILGAIRYQDNIAVVHSDPSFMPTRRRCWSSWNMSVGEDDSQCRVTYWMNKLQNLPGHDFFVSLNPASTPRNVWLSRRYQHPVFDRRAIDAQSRKRDICGVQQTYYCGAYWGWGFHEDGVRSALDAVQRLEGRIRHAA